MKFTLRKEEGGAGEEGTKKLVKKYKKDTPGETVKEVYADSGLGKWFGSGGKGGATKGGWDRYNTKGERIGKCGEGGEDEGKPKCLSRSKAAKMSKKDIGNAVKRKRKADPDTDRPGTGNKPINVSNRIGEDNTMKSFKTYVTEKNKPTNPKLWAASIAAAKSKFDVYPSAYANAWASKNYKSKGGGWKSVSESSLDKMNPEPTAKEMDAALKDKEHDKKLDAIHAKKKKKLAEACWDSHVQQGTKMKGGKVVPNCVPRNEESENKKPYFDMAKKRKFIVPDRKSKLKLKLRDRGGKPATKPYPKLAGESTELDEKSAAWQRKAGKNSEGGLNAAGRKSYERENPGSDLKAPVSAKTASKNPDGKAAGRRKSFCARMGGMPGPMKDDNGKPTRKALALRKWDC